MIDKIVKHIISLEGGFVDHPADRGGPTNFGITQATLTNYLGRHADVDDVKGITKKIAADIYEQHYYHYPRIDQLPEALQPVMTDMAVNHGPRRAIKMLQVQLHFSGYNPGPGDGIIGIKTVAAAKKACNGPWVDFIDNLINRRLNFYKMITENDPSQKVFWSGWMNRAEYYRPENKKVYI